MNHQGRERRGCGGLENGCIQIKTPGGPAYSQQTHLQTRSASGPPGCNSCSETHHPPLRGHLPGSSTGSPRHLFSLTLSCAGLNPYLLANVTSTVPRVSLTQSSPLIGCWVEVHSSGPRNLCLRQPSRRFCCRLKVFFCLFVFNKFSYLFIFGCVGSSLLCVGFL